MTKRYLRATGIVIAFLLLLGTVALGAESPKEARVVIRIPFSKIYRTLNPDSGIVRLAHQNESFPLEHEGRKWYRVWVNEMQTGYISKTDARIQYGKGASAGFRIAISLVVLVVVAGVGGVVRQRSLKGKRERDIVLESPRRAGRPQPD